MKRISPGAFPALKEALTCAYWYKSDLMSFLQSALSASPEVLAAINWPDYKRNIVSHVVDAMARREDQYQGQLLGLMSRVAEIRDFSHLERLDDGAHKAAKARDAVEALRNWITPHEEQLAELKRAEGRRREAYEASLRNQGVQEKLEELKKLFYEVVMPSEPRARGYKLEKILRDLFDLFDLDPKASFRIQGEQVDGAFTFDNTDYLLEAKWEAGQIDMPDLAVFKERIGRRLENTLGLFIAMNGFTARAISQFSTNRPVMFLMDGSDLMAVVDGRIDLGELLLRKRRHAAQTGEIYLPVYKVLTG
ncbi:restriction endonuclease [Micromonospora sp. NPDC049751]|uniref:restriction endonuclease n=1 Tax=Micromonospora sp. NPDC049751 TaxID=3154837 RepID=UPI0033D68AE3